MPRPISPKRQYGLGTATLARDVSFALSFKTPKFALIVARKGLP